MRARSARITLRVTITLCIVMVTIATAVSLLSFDYASSRDALARFTGVLLEPLATLVGEKTDSFLGPVERAAQLSCELVTSAGADPSRFDEIEARWYSLLDTYPDLFYVQYGDVDGNFQLLTRRADGSLATQRIFRHGDGVHASWRERAPGDRAVRTTRQVVDDYDPRVRPWYRGAIDSDGTFWTPVYIHAAEHRPVITAARRVRIDDRVVGVTSVTLALDRLSRFVSELRIARGGRAFIVDHEGHVVAGGEIAARSGSDTARLLTIDEAGSPELATLAQLPVWHHALAGTPDTARFRVRDAGFLGVVRPLRLHGQADWLVAVIVPERDFLAPVERGLRRNIVVSGAITLLFIVVGWLLARAVGSALGHVVEETEQLQQFHFAGGMPRSRFVEIEQIFRTYERLKIGLRAFEKYVPLRLVRMLLEGEAEPRLGGRVGMVTILFSDVRDFTALSEPLTPAEVAELLGDYFQCLSDVITEHGGTVDKFIGDGVMAFWNAPRADADHALHAVTAALQCQAAIASLPRAGKLVTRVGVHTSEVMIGNFGARDRFAYTLLGDGVNLAARLEGANKEYGTKVLISEATAQLLDGAIVCRHIDRVAVKGKSLATNVFEPLGRADELTVAQKTLVRDYETALGHYFAGGFAIAASLFQALLERFPDDCPSATLMRRCQHLMQRPPSSWRGVYELNAK
jgi:adenylate cyclase